MNCSIGKIEREINVDGVEYDGGSVFERFGQLTDIRKARGKRFSLEAILTIIVLAKMCGEDTPSAIADWAKNHQEQILKLLQLKRPKLPHYNTYRRILAHVVYEEEIARLVGEYNQRGEHGEVYAMVGQEPTTLVGQEPTTLDGKAPDGMRKKDEDGSEYLLSVYDPERAQGVVEQQKALAQVAVGRKENEITKAPEALKMVEISQKVVTGDAMHTQKALSAQIISQGGDYIFPVKENQLRLYQNIQQLFAPEYPKPGFAK